MLSNELIDNILESWKNAPGDGIPIPDRDELVYILEIMFKVSLKTEELRQISQRVILIEPDEIENSDEPLGHKVGIFDNDEFRFTIENIRKIALAFDSRTTSIAIKRGVKAREYFIWGTIYANLRGRNRISHIDFGTAAPKAFSVKAVAPGSLELMYGDRIMGRIISGENEIVSPTPFRKSELGGIIRNAIQNHHAFKYENLPYWNYYVDLLIMLLEYSSKQGHGCIIIWITRNTYKRVKHKINSRHIYKNYYDISEPFKNLCHGLAMEKKDPGWNGYVLQIKQQLKEHIEFCAELTSIDGALIIDDLFRPISFGSILNGDEWNGEIVSGELFGKSKQKIIIEQFGSKHNSTIDFIGEFYGMIGFIISEDGPVRGVTKVNPDMIHWWEDCLASLYSK